MIVKSFIRVHVNKDKIKYKEVKNEKTKKGTEEKI